MDLRSLAILAGLSLMTVGACHAQGTGDAAAGEKVFNRCAGCHAVAEGGGKKAGPVLFGVVGRPIGSHPDFQYSAALTKAKDDGLTWTPENLSKWLTSPKDFLPGNRMGFPGLKDQTDIDNVIAYLSTLK